MSLKFVALSIQGKFDEAMKSKFGLVEEAATAAMHDAGLQLKTQARAAIGAGGFGAKWQNTLRVDVYPRSGHSAKPAIHMWHKIPYAGVFETGASIGGKPMMWLPTKNAPARIGRKKVTPRLFAAQIAPLFSVKGAKRPMLVANYGRKRGNKSRVVVFVGVPVITIGKKFSVLEAASRVSGQLAGLYFANLKSE